MTAKRKAIKEDFYSISVYDLEGSFTDVTRTLQEIQKSLEKSEKYKNLKIRFVMSKYAFLVSGERLETDKEYQKRVKANKLEKIHEKERKEILRANELKELARLQKKYGKV